MKRFLSILLVLVLVFSLTACQSGKKKPAAEPAPAAEVPQNTTEPEEPEADNAKVFACEELRITLTDEFQEESGIDYYTGVFDTDDEVVFILREAKSYFGDISMDEYAEMVVKANEGVGHVIEKLHKKDGIPLFEYEYDNESTGMTYAYYTTMFESDDAFWLVQFTCLADEYKDHVETFHRYARSVSFDE
jgi:predicted small lipoprotein YifL